MNELTKAKYRIFGKIEMYIGDIEQLSLIEKR